MKLKQVLAYLISFSLLMGAFGVISPSVSAAGIGYEIADGEWYECITHNLVQDPFGDRQFVFPKSKSYYSLYTKVTDLKPHTSYQLSFAYSATGLFASGIAIVNAPKGKSNPAYIKDVWSLDSDKETVYGRATDDTVNQKYTIAFTTDGNTDYFLSIKANKLSSKIVLSGFLLEETSGTSEMVLPLLQQNWYQNENSAYSTNGIHLSAPSENIATNRISIKESRLTGYSFYTKLVGLEQDTRYTVSFYYDVDNAVTAKGSGVVAAMGGKPEYDRDNALKEGVNEILGDVSLNADARRITFVFTTDERTEYFLSVRTQSVDSAVNFTHFESNKISEAERFGHQMETAQWQATGSTVITHQPETDSIVFTKVGYQAVYTTLSDLELNSTYTISLNHNAADKHQFGNIIYIVAGDEISFGANHRPTQYIKMYGDGSANTSTTTTVTFTTNDMETDYTLVFVNSCPNGSGGGGTAASASVANVTLSNFKVSKKSALEFIGNSIRVATAERQQGLRFYSKIDKTLLKNGINGAAVTEIGIVAAFTQQLEGEELSLTHKNAKMGVAFSASDKIHRFWSEDTNYLYMTASMVGLEPKDYDVDITAASYIQLENGSVLYGEKIECCVYDVFRAITEKGKEEDKIVVFDILQEKTIFDDYSAWQEVNTKTYDAPEYFLSLRTGSSSKPITLSNFTITENGQEIAATTLLANHWYNNQIPSYYTNGTHLTAADQNVQTGTIQLKYNWLTGYSYYTKLTNLKPNTTYVITFQSDIDNTLIANGSGIVEATVDKPYYNNKYNTLREYNRNHIIGTVTSDVSTNIITYTFTTKGEYRTVKDGNATDDANDISAHIEVEVPTVDLKIYNAQAPVNTNYKGLNATVWHSYPFQNDRTYTSQQKDMELTRLENMGFSTCRTYFGKSYIYGSGSFHLNSTHMDDFADYCMELQSRDMDVMLNFLWYLSDLIDYQPGGSTVARYLSGLDNDWYGEQITYQSCVASSFKLSGSMNPYEYDSNDRMGNSTADFSETTTEYFNRLTVAALRNGSILSKLITNLQARGIHNVDYLVYFTEPSYYHTTENNDPTGAHNQEYLFICRTIRNVLEKEGIQIKHVGPNQGSITLSGGLLDYVIDRDPNLFDIATAHFYPIESNPKNDTYYENTYNGIQSFRADLEGAGLWGKKEFWLDEIYASVSSVKGYMRRDYPVTGTQTIVSAIAGQQHGVDNILLWQAFDMAWYQNRDTSNSYDNGIHVCGMAPSLLVSDVPYKAYYQVGLFTRYNNSKEGGKAIATSSGECNESSGIYVGATELPDGNFTITVVSVSPENLRFHLQLEEALGKDLFRHTQNVYECAPDSLATLAQSDCRFKDVQTTLVDSITPFSVHIYTTRKD